jgi:hypothetical protein
MKFVLWLFAGLFLIINSCFFFGFLLKEGVGGGLVLGSAIVSLGLSLGTSCLLKARASLTPNK